MSETKGSSVRSLAERGEPLSSLGWRIIDGHAHLGPTGSFYIPTPDAASMVRMMDRLGIAMTGISSHLAINSDYIRGNDLTAATVRCFPGRFFGYVAANPHYKENMLDELRRGYDALGLCAIKLHPALHNFSVSDASCDPIWSFADEREAVVLTHTWEGDDRCRPSLFAQLAEAHPQVSFLLGHSGGTPAARREAADVATAHENVYLEICCSTLTSAELEYTVGQVGAERVIFGTDSPWLDPRFVLGKVAHADLSDEQLRLVMGDNIRRLLQLPQP